MRNVLNLPQAGAGPAPHLSAPSAHGWSFWRVLECRSAGFPAAAVLGFADPDCAAAADALVRARSDALDAWNGVRAGVKARIKAMLDDVRHDPPASARHRQLQQEILALRADAKAIDRRQFSAAFCARTPLQTVQALRAAEASRQLAAARYDASVAAAHKRSRDCASAFARTPRFAEAVTWQNPLAAHSAVALLATPSGDGAGAARLRRSEQLVAMYAQRYCTKNDTIGFFGPVGWATLGDGPEPIRYHCEAHLLARRSVYFEDWAIQALAARLSARPALRQWCTPRRMPYLRLEGVTLHLPTGAATRLSDEQAAVLGACDGQLTAAAIAAALTANPFLDFNSADEVYAIMEELAASQRLAWGFAVCASDAWPERHLRTQLQAITDDAQRLPAVAALDALEAARAALAAAAGDARAVASSSAQLGAVFEQVCGLPSNRRAGETYGARTLAYEDCQRAMSVQLGTQLSAPLQAALDPVLASARWFCYQLALGFGLAFEAIFERLARADGALNFTAFWADAQGLFFGAAAFDASAIQAQLWERWEAILAAPAVRPCVQHDSAAVMAAIGAAFDVPHCGWRAACHQSPDVMIAAADVDAVARGEYLFVLGELHLGLNTLMNHSAVNQFDEPWRLLAMLAADRGAPRIMPCLSRAGTQQPIRVQTVLEPGVDIELCFSHDARPLDPASALDIGQLVVQREQGGAALVVQTRDGARSFALLDVFGELLSGFAADKFALLAHAPYRPRIAIDRLVVQRQAWRFSCAELPFVACTDSAAAFLEARSWRLERQLPRWVFVKTPWEQKPFYLDFDSPLYVWLLARQIRNAQDGGVDCATLIGMSEMLPAHSQAWLSDAEGHTYTSELRIVAIHADDANAFTHQAGRP
ncbi:lantibiotic dehydratase family protein [Massilia sp. PAMC28688]|uniref:lantibiotic dehydratase n=1 Tax=Massilia sp. PAMC28688 TaxID=2861283 RepID=UPI001C635F04|nr:lantibiotic dehydratase [Massilia sp. PAMC28688]QYF92617.1 lantibiotic dehydratase family protein [Massilia sp. PAMC28688]